MERRLLARGIVTWHPFERRTDRYGSLYVARQNSMRDVKAEMVFDVPLAESLTGSRVKLSAVVLEARKSHHCGDLFHNILPTQPSVGEQISLGVGTLEVDLSGKLSEGEPVIQLKPGDGRDTFWFDPRLLYRLHDQTVEVWIEPTEEPFSPAPHLPNDKAN